MTKPRTTGITNTTSDAPCLGKAAIVDLGSNSFRLLVGTFDGTTWYNEPKRLWTTRLGQRDANGLLTPEAFARGLTALREINEAIQAYGATVVLGAATSAIREAPNGATFLAEAVTVCPMDAKILTGEEEAAYGFEGATHHIAEPGYQYATVDVGGGSTEIAIGGVDGVVWRKSYPIGAVRLREKSEEGPQAVWEETSPWFDPWPLTAPFGGCVAIGGTATTLAAMDLKMTTYDGKKIQGHKLMRETVEDLIMQLRWASPEERLQFPGLPANRADIIVAGAEIITSFMDTYQLPYLMTSDTDGMEGMQRIAAERLMAYER